MSQVTAVPVSSAYNTSNVQSTGSWWDSMIAFGKEALGKIVAAGETIEKDVKAVVEKGIEITKDVPGLIDAFVQKAEEVGPEIIKGLGELNGVLKNLQNNPILDALFGPSFENLLKEGISLTNVATEDLDIALKALPGFADKAKSMCGEINQFLKNLDTYL